MARGLVSRAAAAATAATGITLTAEVLWAAHRPLPRPGDIDTSGMVNAERDGTPMRVVVLGDSTLTGPGLTSPDDVWVRQALMTVDLGRPVDLISYAVGGSRVADVVRRLDDVDLIGVDAVILSVGSNDAIHGTGVRRFARTYDALLARLLAEVPVVALTNIGDLGRIARLPRPLRQIIGRRGRTFCRTVERVAAGHRRAVLLDVTPSNHWFRDRSLFGPDLFHPTRAGHTKWAEVAAPHLLLALCRAEVAGV